MTSSWPGFAGWVGGALAGVLVVPSAWAVEAPAVTAAVDGAEVVTGHLFNALLYGPSGLVAAALWLEFFAQWKRNREVEPAILFLLCGAAVAAVGVAGLAYVFSPVGRASGELPLFAMWMGGVAAAISLAFLLKRLARNRRLFSLVPAPELAGRVVVPRTFFERGLINGYRLALGCAFLLSLVGVSEMPLSQARSPSVAGAVRALVGAWGQPSAPPPAAVAGPVAEAPVSAPVPAPVPAPAGPSLAALLESGQPLPPGAAAAASLAATVDASMRGQLPVEPAGATRPEPAPPPPATRPPEGAGPGPSAGSERAPSTVPPEPAAPPVPATAKPAPGPAATPKPAAAGVASKLPSNFFVTKIKPILDSKCVECHGSTKQKGDLRLDSVAAIKQGAGHPVVVAGDLELSSLYQRLVTPDKEDLMPPPAKGGALPAPVIAMVKTWIQAGADFGDGAGPVGQAPVAARPGGVLEEEKSRGLGVPSAAVTEALTQRGAVIRPMSANGALLDINLTHYEAGQVNLAELTPIAPNILALDLTRTRLQDDDLAPIAGMSHLVRLDLKRNALSDAALVHLKGLSELETLNLFDTQVTDAGLVHLAGLKRLQKVFLFNTKVTAAGADRLRAAIPGVVVNLGE